MESFKPDGIQSMVPYLFVADVPRFVEFAQAAFGIEVLTETKNDDDVTFYATLKFDDTVFFVQEPSDEQTGNCALYLYVPDLQAAYERAISAGATSVAAPAEQYHGDSLAILRDEWGLQWFLAYASVILDDDQVRERRQEAGQ